MNFNLRSAVAAAAAFQTALVLQRVFTLVFVAQAQSCAADLRQVHTYVGRVFYHW